MFSDQKNNGQPGLTSNACKTYLRTALRSEFSASHFQFMEVICNKPRAFSCFTYF